MAEGDLYEIRVKGRLGPEWSTWFGMAIQSQPEGSTLLVGQVADQAALHGILSKINDLGLPLLALRRIEPDRPGE
jgi:hypothetical protein